MSLAIFRTDLPYGANIARMDCAVKCYFCVNLRHFGAIG